MAALLGITGSAVSQWESGRTAPTRARLVEIARIVQRTPNWLQFALDDEGPGPRVVPKLTFAEAIQEPPLQWDTTDLGVDAIQPHHPCSDLAFALEIPDGYQHGEFERGDLVIIDPLAQPDKRDWVLVVTPERPKGAMAEVMFPRGYPEEGDRILEEMDALLTEAINSNLSAQKSVQERHAKLKERF